MEFLKDFDVGGASANTESTQEHTPPSKSASPQSPRTKTSRRYSPRNRRRERNYSNPVAGSQNATSTIREVRPQAETPSQAAAPHPQTSSKAGIWLFIILIVAGLAYYIFSGDSKKGKPAVESPASQPTPIGTTVTNQTPSLRPSAYVASENSETKEPADTPTISSSVSTEATSSDDVPPQRPTPSPRISDASEPSISVSSSADPSAPSGSTRAPSPAPIKDLDSQFRMNVAVRLERLGFPVDWQSHSLNEMSDWEMRINLANRLRRMGLDVDWQKYSFSQMSDWELRMGIAKRLARKGLDVDWQKHSFSEMSDWDLRMSIAERLKRKGVDINWQDYTFTQMIEMEKRIR
ncbi:MAG: hypothetical protein L0226_17895 [Acidobacteria bacterium]|nr:hypothetical protein [Acidobacteriota bacterium]